MNYKPFLLLCVLGLFMNVVSAQRPTGKYPSLLWEISKKGDPKKSYLFGTMHVSSKMVFHLSDSFYLGIKQSDVVAIELDPLEWQDQLYRYEEEVQNYQVYQNATADNFIRPFHLSFPAFKPQIKSALKEEPSISNGLLYRNYQGNENFEENTYLDLYIYQTARKLGKQTTGVEHYRRTQEVILQAKADQINEEIVESNQTKKEEEDREVGRTEAYGKINEAYRKGDLDLLDSMETIVSESKAYNEKFLYLRNEIQAASMDSIMKSGKKLFVGVGAAHLAGERGVIEILRRMGYTLRPIYMVNRDAAQKDQIDKIKAPVTLAEYAVPELGIAAQMPGPFYRRTDNRAYQTYQYSDMSNGVYYLLSRVPYYSVITDLNKNKVIETIDSLLYENIPGKIISKTKITRGVFSGFDIVNKTRKGDSQRYQILVSPFEVFVFKVNGPDQYTSGAEVTKFFNSIKLPQYSAENELPNKPKSKSILTQINKPKYWGDYFKGYQIGMVDTANSKASLQMTFRLDQHDLIEEDSFSLAILAFNFEQVPIIKKELSRSFTMTPSGGLLKVSYETTDGNKLYAQYVATGGYFSFYVENQPELSGLIPSSKLVGLTSSEKPTWFIDSSLLFKVKTSYYPKTEQRTQDLMAAEKDLINKREYGSQFQTVYKNASFMDRSLKSGIFVTAIDFKGEYYNKDSTKFWKQYFWDPFAPNSLIYQKVDTFWSNRMVSGFDLVLRDTASQKAIRKKVVLNGNRMVVVSTDFDANAGLDEAQLEFFNSFELLPRIDSVSIFKSPMERWYADFSSSDSLLALKARKAINDTYFGKTGWTFLKKAIETGTRDKKEYVATKEQLIRELGYIKDSTSLVQRVQYLQELYDANADTTRYQNAVLQALANMDEKLAVTTFLKLIVNDPPVFEENNEYEELFSPFEDSLKLATLLFPEINKLISIESYKEPILDLLVTIKDSGLYKPEYSPELTKMIFDAKIELKKAVNTVQNEQIDAASSNVDFYGSRKSTHPDLEKYFTLLAPYYKENAQVQKIFATAFKFPVGSTRTKALLELIGQGVPVDHALLINTEKNQKERKKLYEGLYVLKQLDCMSPEYKSENRLLETALVSELEIDSLSEIEVIKKQWVQSKTDSGWFYILKYRKTEKGPWRIAGFGLLDFSRNHLDMDFTHKPEEVLKDLDKALKAAQRSLNGYLFGLRPSGRFYANQFNRYNRFTDDDEEE